VTRQRTGDPHTTRRAAIVWQAEEVLRGELQPGEDVRGSVAMTASPSRWSAAVLLAVALMLVAAGVADLVGPQQGPVPTDLVIGVAAPLLSLGPFLLSRQMYVVVTDRRLICVRLSRFRRAPTRLAFAVRLADFPISNRWLSPKHNSIQCQIPDQKQIRLHAGWAQRTDFATVARALSQSGAFAKLDPPYPSVTASAMKAQGLS
jgi:di/tricarboxylate transporter